MKVRKAVIPAAGLGTRFLPITKSVPKELLPILDRPMLQYVIEEAAEAGIEEVIIVTARGKESIAAYFQPQPALEQHLADTGAAEFLDKVRHASTLADVSFVIQEQPLGLGHAVLIAKDAVGDEPFVVILPDDIIAHTPGALSQMLEVSEQYNGGVVAVEPMPWEMVHNYGVVDATQKSERVHQIHRLVEKPPREEAPSNLTVVGRYILPAEIFQCLERTLPGAKNEIQLTDGMSLLMESQDLYAYEFQGIRYDGGTPLGLLRASLEFALAREDTREAVKSLISNLPESRTKVLTTSRSGPSESAASSAHRGQERLVGALMIGYAVAVGVQVLIRTATPDSQASSFEPLIRVTVNHGLHMAGVAASLVASVFLIVLAAGLYSIFRPAQRFLALAASYLLLGASLTWLLSAASGLALGSLGQEITSTAVLRADNAASIARALDLIREATGRVGFTLAGLGTLALGGLIAWRGSLPKGLGWFGVVVGILMLFIWNDTAALLHRIGGTGYLIWLLGTGIWMLGRGTRPIA